jgi:hypothetical protein
MGATTKSGRTRNRRAQALNTIINGQGATLYFYSCNVDGAGVVTIGLWSSELSPYPLAIAPPSPKLRIILVNAIGIYPQEVDFVLTDEIITFSPTPAPVGGNNIAILAWNEDLRGANGEWFNGGIMDVGG